MSGLDIAFNIMSLCGIWMPQQWESHQRNRSLYSIWSGMIVSGIIFLLAAQSVLFFINDFSVEFVVSVLFTLLTGISVLVKAMSFLLRRDGIMLLTRMLVKNCCLPRDEFEFGVEKKDHDFLRIFTVCLNALAQGTMLVLLLSPLAYEEEIRNLPYQMWLPYGIHYNLNKRNYWMTYAMEVPVLITAILINCSTDVVIIGFVIRTRSQLDILKYRMFQLPSIVRQAKEVNLASDERVRLLEKEALQKFSQHHDHIIKCADQVSATFDVIILEQFIAGALNFSVIIYVMTIGNFPAIQKVLSSTYLTCLLCQMFCYYWFGNEITVKSLEFSSDIYEIDWLDLSKDAIRMLIFMMVRAEKPIMIGFGSLVILNNDSFKGILKVTYSAYNLLKESKNT